MHSNSARALRFNPQVKLQRSYATIIAIFVAWSTALGCAGYKIGTRNLFRDNIRTIHVSIAKSDSFRPELAGLLTEILQKEIERRTPYKLTDQATADSILTCRLTTDSKRVVGETRTDEPRLLQSILTAELSWVDRRGQPLIENRFLPLGESTFYFAENSNFIPEAGQSIATAHQRGIERIANHIVDQMEVRW
ncbi:MAG: LPS assembly lipoprotein LptE [Pirellula sp.]